MLCLLLFASGLLEVFADTPAMSLDLAFSLDGGKTFSTEAPRLPEPGKVRVRARWNLADPAICRDSILLSLSSAGSDFGSANVGPQNWDGVRRWYQKPVPGWVGPATREATLVLDTQFRPEGVMGSNNRWDKSRNQYVDGPLPACASLAAGEHTFALRVYFKHATTGETVAAVREFAVTIEKSDTFSSLPEPAAAPAPKPTGIAPADVKLPQADHVLKAQSLAVCWPSDRLTTRAVFAKSGRETAWRVEEIPEGYYFLGLFAVIGDRGAARHLGVQEPWLYVNGRAVQFSTCSVPVEVSGIGIVGELYSREAVALKPGDEIRLGEKVARRWTAQLGLYAGRPVAGPLDVRPYVSPESDDLFRVTAGLTVPPDNPALGQATATLTNVRGHAAKFQAGWRVLNYFQETVAAGTEAVTLDNRSTWSRTVEFPTANSDRYRVILTVVDEDGNKRESVAEALVDAPFGAYRAKLWLNGEWDFLALPPGTGKLGAIPGDDAGWKKKSFPGFWPHDDYTTPNDNHCAWVRRTFTVPDWMTGPRLFARIGAVDYEAVVYVNGRRAGEHFGPKDPFELDITDFVKRDGPNEILIGMRDSTLAAFSNGKPIATGSRNCGYLSDVEIFAQPAVAITDVFVKPSFRHKNLTVDCTTSPAAAGLRLQQAVYFGGAKVLELPEVTVTAAGRATATAAWDDPILWDVGKPDLLRLDTRLVDVRGATLDLCQTRFGFREIWPEGPALYLNGREVKLRAYAMDSGWSTLQKSRADLRRRAREALAFGGQAKMHGSNWHGMMDVADEEGLLLAQNIAGPSGPTQQIIESDEYWRNMELFATRCIAQFKNHPSVVVWKLSNEFSEHSDLVEKATQRLQTLGEVVKRLDETRISEFSCDLDIRGWADIISTHYPVDLGALRTADVHLPDGILWRPGDTPFTVGMQVPAGQFKRVANVKGDSRITWGEKPILVNETGWNVFYGPLGGFAGVAGDGVYRSPWAAEEAHTAINEWFMAGHRDAGVNLICPWQRYDSGAMLRTVPPIDAFPLTRHTRWYEGQEVVWQVNLHHDVAESSEVVLDWSLESPSAKTVAGKITRTMQPAELLRTQVAFKVPAVSGDTAATLRLTVSADGQKVRERTFACRLFKQRPLQGPSAPVALFDPPGGTRQRLAQRGIASQELASLAAESLAGVRVLVIGEDAAGAAEMKQHADAIRDFVHQGGSVLALRQTQIDSAWLPLGVSLSTKKTSIGFVRAPLNPLLQGFDDDDFRFWFPYQLVSSQDYLTPRLGNATPLIDSGMGNNDMEYTPLLEIPYGSGRYVLCQLRLLQGDGANPVADRLLEQMLAVMAQPRPSPRLTAVATAAAPLAATLQRLGLVSEAFDPEKTDQYGQLIVDAQEPVAAPLQQSLKVALEQGASILIKGAGPDDADWLSVLLSQKIEIVPPLLREWSGRLIRTAEDPLLEGISNADLFWRRNPRHEDVGSVYSQDAFLEDKLYDHVITSETGIALTFPGALVKFEAGKGMVLLDTTRWAPEDPSAKRKAERLASLLLTNLGCTLREQSRREWVECQSYAAVDLSSLANRGLIDEVADDSRGGWTDQGPKADLREFTPGRQTFHGVPFEVAPDKSCIVLASKNREAGPPQQVRIPVNRRARALFFLQSSAWTSAAHHASYFVRYADCTAHEIQLVGGLNLRDWISDNAAAPFPLETETYTRHAWGGSCEQFKQAHLFVMQWINPRPGTSIEAIDFVSTNEGVPILLGLTAGFDTAQKSVSEQDRQRASALLATAIVAHDKQQQDEAEALLVQAIEIAPDTLEAYIRLGAIYEKQQRPEQAAAVYRASLKVNPNQPIIYEALKRVEK